MLIIGENINILNPQVYESITSEDFTPIVDLAMLQVHAGADVLDIHLGPDISNGERIIKKIVKVIQQSVNVPLFLNGTVEMIEAGLEEHRGRAIINGVTGEKKRRDQLLSLAKAYDARVVGMTIPETGTAKEINDKCSIAVDIIEDVKVHGLSIFDVFLDPMVTPFSLSSDTLTETICSLRTFKETFEDAKTFINLSSLSQGLKKKNTSIINSTSLGILIGTGLDAVLLNPLDKLVADTAKTAKILCSSAIYCDSYLDAAQGFVPCANQKDLEEISNKNNENLHLLWKIGK